jgi:hypothetical protein
VGATVAADVPGLRASLEMLLISAMGLALSHLLRFVVKHKHWRRLRWSARAPRLVAMSLLLSLCAAGTMNVLGLAS